MAQHFRLPIRVVFYKEGDVWIAHCLEFDLVGHGPTHREALHLLSGAIESQIDTSYQLSNPDNLFSPAEGKFFGMFAAGNECCHGELEIKISGANMLIERAEYREYSGSDMAFA
jgi:hypothetical protein